MVERLRIDQLLVARGIFESRARAQAAIAAGQVWANGTQIRKSSDTVAHDAAIDAQAAHPWVSRGGVKLDAALTLFQILVAGKVCLDVGASTGGFTDVLLARGAEQVYAVDVGQGQLHSRLREHPAVVSLEQTDIRALATDTFDPKPRIIVIDASFISLKHVLPAALKFAAPACDIIALIKPQFEAGRAALKKGIVRDSKMHAATCDELSEFARTLGLICIEIAPSCIAGGDGNSEFFLRARRG